MNRVRGQHARSKHTLAKQLDEIKAQEKAARLRHQKAITSLGTDLDRIHRSSREMGRCFSDSNPSPPVSSRRPSLPASLSDLRVLPTSSAVVQRETLASFPVLGAITPRRKSVPVEKSALCQGAQSVDRGDHSIGTGNSSSQSSSRRGSSTEEGAGAPTSLPSARRGSLDRPKTTMAAVTTQRRSSQPNGKSLTRPSHSAGKRHSADGSHVVQQPRVKDMGTPRPTGGAKRHSISVTPDPPAPANHHTTEVFVHQDEDGEQVSSPSLAKPTSEVHSSENSMFALNQFKSRRASEPQIGSHVLRQLQQKADQESATKEAPHPHLGPENEAMKKAIESQLPSNIVAEEDGDEDDSDDDEEEKRRTNDNNSEHSDNSKNGAKPKKSTSKQRNGESPSRGSKSSSSSNTGSMTSLDLAASADEKLKAKMKSLNQRRKSDGDVLKFVKVWRFRSLEKSLTGKGGKELLAGAGKGEAGASKDPENSTIWDAVRKCRYIRGYDPPDMRQPADLGEFVFGHKLGSEEDEA